MDRRTFLSHSGRLLAAAGLAPRMFAENRMPESNQRRSLSFSNDWIESVLVSTVRNMPVEDAIVVNLSTIALHYRVGGDHGTVLPWKSAMLRRCTLESGETVALLHVRQRTNLGGVALGWEWYGRRNPQFPRGTPLYISPQDEIGDVQLDPVHGFTYETSVSASPRRYDQRVADPGEVHRRVLRAPGSEHQGLVPRYRHCAQSPGYPRLAARWRHLRGDTPAFRERVYSPQRPS